MASMYEEMSDEMAAADDAAADDAESTETETEPELDGEFAMLAEELGFTGEKAATLKKLIERCVDLRDEGAYTETEPEEGEETDDDELGL